MDTLLAQVWVRLVRGVGDRHAAARHPALATVGPDGSPQVRTVVLRAADPVAAVLEVHTDLRSAKVAALRHDPRGVFHVWDGSARLQTRIEVLATVLSGDAVAAVWARVPAASRSGYGSIPAPGSPIPSALDYAHHPNAAAFAVLRLAVQAIDALHLGSDHRRARFDRADNWVGQWLAP